MKFKFAIALDNIRSALNVGSIIRTAESAGVDKIFLCGITPDLTNEKVLKTSLGAEKTIEIEYKKSTFELIKELKDKNVQIVSLELSEKAEVCSKASYQFPLCLMLGNEVAGISEETLKLSDKIIEIPMRGEKNSLNVSVASGIAIYEISNKIN